MAVVRMGIDDIGGVRRSVGLEFSGAITSTLWIYVMTGSLAEGQGYPACGFIVLTRRV